MGGNITYSSKINRDLRIVWDYSQNEVNIIDLIDLGGHDGGKGVYS